MKTKSELTMNAKMIIMKAGAYGSGAKLMKTVRTLVAGQMTRWILLMKDRSVAMLMSIYLMV